MTEQEKELLELINSHPDREYALQKAIEIIITELAGQSVSLPKQ